MQTISLVFNFSVYNDRVVFFGGYITDYLTTLHIFGKCGLNTVGKVFCVSAFRAGIGTSYHTFKRPKGPLA